MREGPWRIFVHIFYLGISGLQDSPEQKRARIFKGLWKEKSNPCIVRGAGAVAREIILNRGVERIFKQGAYASFLLGHERRRLKIWKRNFQHSSLGTKEF